MQASGDPGACHPASKAPWQGHPGREGPCALGGGDALKSFSKWRNTPFSPGWCSACVCVRPRVLSHVKVFATPRLKPTRLFCPWDSPGKNTGGEKTPFSRDLPNPGKEKLSCAGRQILHHGSHHNAHIP